MQFFAIRRVPSSSWPGTPNVVAPLVLFCVPEGHHSILGFEPQRLEDLPLGVHPAAHPALDPVDGQSRNTCPPRELGLRHHPLHAQLADVVLYFLGRAGGAYSALGLLLVPRSGRIIDGSALVALLLGRRLML